YRVSLTLMVGPDVYHQATAPATNFGSVVTDEATFERVTPTGVDAEIWERMQAASLNRHWALVRMARSGALTDEFMNASKQRALWSEIVRDFPESGYLP